MSMESFEQLYAHPLAVVAVCIAVIVAGILDLRSRRMAYVLTVPFFAASMFWALVTGGLLAAGEFFVAALLFAAPFVCLFLVDRTRAMRNWAREHAPGFHWRGGGRWIRH